MTTLTADLDAVNELFASGVITGCVDLLMISAIFAAMVWLDWRLTLVMLSLFPVAVAVTLWYRAAVRRAHRWVRGAVADINGFLQENFAGIATVQLFSREASSVGHFNLINERLKERNVEALFYQAIYYPAMDALGASAVALLLWAGGMRVIDRTLTLGVLVAMLQYSHRMLRPVNDLSDKFSVLQAAIASLERVFDILERAPSSHVAVVDLRPSVGRIAFDHVWFTYDGEEFALRDVSFVVDPCERVGVVGATGSGKTTLVNLLYRFYDVTSGRITLDGVDIRTIEVSKLRSLFAIVPQEPQIVTGTIADNIRFGDDAIDGDCVRRASKAARADGFIEALPDKYATWVAEGGRTLSAGEKQLLSLARALATEMAILILDEATSNLDVETELMAGSAIMGLKGQTVIAIAHRLAMIQKMDKIVVLHKGRVHQVGTHEELISANGIYSRLYELHNLTDASGEPRLVSS